MENLYLHTNGDVTVGDFISDNFEINLEVTQSDPPSPFFVFLNGWMDYAQTSYKWNKMHPQLIS